jgi:hypothetical protein
MRGSQMQVRHTSVSSLYAVPDFLLRCIDDDEVRCNDIVLDSIDKTRNSKCVIRVGCKFLLPLLFLDVGRHAHFIFPK